MTEKAAKYLSDIQSAICLIESFLDGFDSFSKYQSDLKTQSAIERQLGIIGEATNKLRQVDNSVILSHTKQIVNFRNRLIHSYDSIDASIVWVIAKNHLPVLKHEINEILSQNNSAYEISPCASLRSK